MTGADPRENLGRLVRAVWIDWALEQPDSKPSWLLQWDDPELDDAQREVDMRIGERIAVTAAAAERDRIASELDADAEQLRHPESLGYDPGQGAAMAWALHRAAARTRRTS